MSRCVATDIRAPLVSLPLLLALVAGCGDDTTGVGAGGTGGGAGAGATGGSGGSAGTSNVADVFNPALPVPSYDCRADTATKACVSISGTVAGQSVDRHCAGATPPGALARNPTAFPVACQESGSPLTGYWYQVTVPVQGPGVFSYELAPGGAYSGANVTVALDGGGGEVRSDHFMAGKLAGSIVPEGAEDELISGTFRMTWTMPGASCQAVGPDECAPADVNGTFRVLNVLDTN